MNDDFDPATFDAAEYGIDPVDHANQVLGISLFNGLFTLTMKLAKRGILDEEDVQAMHDAMSKPLSLGDPNGTNVGMANLQERIDSLMSVLTEYFRTKD